MKFVRFVFKWLFLFVIWVAICGVIAVFYYFRDLPSLDELKNKDVKIVQINYSNDNRITNRGDIYANKVGYYELPMHLIDAVVAIEDRRFFSHHGIDIFGIMRAYYVNAKSGRIVQGGSTITQQLAKLLFLNPNKTFKRKIQEALLAIQLEYHLTKEQILTLYLNYAYFGSGNYGISDAAKHYFDKDVSQLNLNESALLAGLLKAPSKFSPKNNRKLAEERSNLVLSAMIEEGFLNEENLAELDDNPNYKMDHAQRFYFTDFVHGQFLEFLGKEEKEGRVITITTSMDEKIQETLEDVLDRFIYKNLKKLDKSQISVVIMNKEGAVLGMSGGRDYRESQFNRAVYAKRQAGSAFKTFVYLSAFDEGFSPDDVFEDKRINIGGWIPENYGNHYSGKVTLQRAFANSLNSVAVQLARLVGGDKIASMARKCGITSRVNANDLTISLGTVEVSLLELTSSYATIANGGVPVIPYIISEIRDEDYNVIYQRKSSGFDYIISEKSEQDIKKLLLEVVKSGTGRRADSSQRVYGKTGTSQNFRDAWFIGFNNDYVVGVWIGNDDNSPTNKIVGGSLPAMLFARILEKI